MAIKFWVARTVKGGIITYGRGVTDKIAEMKCREHVAREKKEMRVDRYESFVMPKPKFRIGQKVRRVRIYIGEGKYAPMTSAKPEKVKENARDPLLDGSFLIHKNGPVLGLYGEWVREDDFEAVA